MDLFTELAADRKKRQRREAQQRRRDKWRAAGLCLNCGSGPGPTCEGCLKKMRAAAERRVADRRQKGQCYRCRAKLDPKLTCMTVKYPQCEVCFMKSMADQHLGSRHRWTELMELFKRQRGRCAYTREKLVLGDTASLDHIVPKARGGGDEIGNLQWVTWTVNNCKRDLTHEEFVTLCKKVAG